ncbi:MAG TPA: class I SAM-dependent methyltransferase [Thermoleophilaceae bacterium]|nr:class I SAM-dependent methyltransferase [Thermoleophilaceae bacterium]
MAKQRSGDSDYQAYVGGPGRYDRLSALQFRVLIDAGLRDGHRVCDVGCGSLRLGRLLIPFLKPHCYFGVEPNRWLVEEGFERELGRDIVSIKHPRFRYVDDFSLEAFGESFDYIIAYSVLTHCYTDLFLLALEGMRRALAPKGVLIATFVENHDAPGGTEMLDPGGGNGWLYPKCVRYTWAEVADLLAEGGLMGAYVRRNDRHRQQWLVAGPSERRVHRVTEALES